MPKIVDHDERRRDIVAAVVRIITRDGIERCTLRTIAREAGTSLGVLAHYFADKDDILTTALGLSHERIYARIEAKLEGVSGLEAVREFVLDNLPLDDERLMETQLEITYWARALSDPGVHAVQRREATSLRAMLLAVVGQAMAAGEIGSGLAAEEIAERLLALINGLSLHAVLYPERVTHAVQEAQVEAELNRLRGSAR